MKNLLLFFTLLLAATSAKADAIDSLESELRDHPQIQEKIYIHTDNTCYYAGDTLWYRAFVVRSDDFKPSDISKLLYVELVNGEGIVMQRQQLVVSDNGMTHGDFALSDSIGSGYYELRAYTKWNLNFGVTHRHYLKDDRYKFYNYQMAADYFREWNGLYSRVIPIYAKPEEKGEYNEKYIYNRPKEDLVGDPSDKLKVKFYPEGGSLVDGLKSRVAFEVTDQLGRNVDISGKLDDGTTIKTDYQGRGVFDMTGGKVRKASFTWEGNNYNFNLPKTLDTGTVLRLDDGKLTLTGSGAEAFAVLCRGKLQSFTRIKGQGSYKIDYSSLPTGINEIVVFDHQASPIASRLFFVNHHDQAVALHVSTDKTEYAPYAPVAVKASADVSAPISVSLAVRDGASDDESYDDGNILTEMLLSSELKGFIAYPGWYFKSDDKQHTQALDELMMVQGWRRYKRLPWLRYQPEKALTIEGHVYKVPEYAEFAELTDLDRATTGDVGLLGDNTNQGDDQDNGQYDNPWPDTDEENTDGNTDADYGIVTEAPILDLVDNSENGTGDNTSDGGTEKAVNQHAYGAGVLVEAELERNGQSAGVIEKTDNRGHFSFNVPAYYGKAILFIKAYKEKDSLKYAMSTGNDKGWRDERAYPNFYVKRDMFYPIYASPYSWYQTHQPEFVSLMGIDEDAGGAPQNSKLAGDHQLQTVKVVASRRTRRGIDYDKPAQILDVYNLYNNVTDYGLSFGIFEAQRFPGQVATYLYGNLGMNRSKINIRARLDGTTFYRNYTPAGIEYDRNQAPTAMFDKMRLDRLKSVKVYTDYEPRVDGKILYHSESPAVTMDFESFPDDAKQYTYRDRRYVLDGIAMPDEFYSPDYSKQKPQPNTDYRRTLYWNPNVTLNPGEDFSATCYNNGHETKVKVSAAGITSDGKVLLLQNDNAKK